MKVSLLLLCLIPLVRGRIHEGPSSYIVNGQTAADGAYPWQLALYKDRPLSMSFSCGSSLVAPNIVMTAAHCVDGNVDSPSDVVFFGGSNDRADFTTPPTGTAQFRTSVSITVHPEWNPAYDNGEGFAHVNDIALCFLDSPFNVDPGHLEVAMLDGPGNSPFTGDNCMMSGWGRTSGSGPTSNILLEASIEVYDPDTCSALIRSYPGQEYPNNQQAPGQVCMYDVSGQAGNPTGACSGDSGSPLNCGRQGDASQTVVSGIASYVTEGCLTDYPSVYTRVSYYCAWIQIATGGVVTCPGPAI